MNHLIRKWQKNNSGQYLVYVSVDTEVQNWEIEKIFYKESSATNYIKERNDLGKSNFKDKETDKKAVWK